MNFRGLPQWFCNKPYTACLAKLYDLLRDILINSEETCYIYRKEWMIESIMTNLSDILNSFPDESDIESAVKSAYAVLALMLEECLAELSVINKEPFRQYELPPEPLKYDINSSFEDNMRIFAEYTLSSLNVTKRIQSPIDNPQQIEGFC